MIHTRRAISLILAAAILSTGSGCTSLQNANKTQKGAGIGVVGGALAGALIGKNFKSALLGAAIGGLAGSVIGNIMDRQAQKIEEVLPGAEVERVGEGILVVLDEKSGVNFAFDSAELTSATRVNLDKLAEVFLEYPDTEIALQGHTDSKGAEEYNQKLSERRAESVANYLASQGVDRARMVAEGFGERSPRFTNDTAEGRSKNRRVEFAIVAGQEMIEDARASQN